MSKLKKIILILSIIVILLIITILSIINLNKGELIYEIDELGSEEELYNINTTLQYVNVRNDYYTVKTCIQKFYIYYFGIFQTEENNYDFDIEQSSESSRKNNIQAVYNILDEEYLKYKDINLDNILSKIDKINESVIDINKMYVSQKTTNMYVYIAEGRMREKKTGNISDFKILLKLDALNKTYSVYLGDFIEQNYNNLQIGEEIDINVANNIENKEYNIYNYEIVNDETYVKDLFAKNQEEMMFDKEAVYNHLDENYKNLRFGNFATFENYAKNYLVKNLVIKLSKYQKTKYDDYTEYVCIDQNGNYYIFNEKHVMDYDLILDTYTIDGPEFIKKYEEGTEQIKVGMNINKIILAIDSKDYKYVYNKLDDSFKNKYFDTIDKFIKFIENNFFENNKIEYNEFKNLGGIYTYKLNVKDSKNSENINDITVIVKLLENREFIISFEIK